MRRATDRQAGIGFGGRWERDGSVAVATIVGVALFTWGLFVIARMLLGVQRGDLSFGDFLWIPVLVSTAAEACGIALLARQRTRWIGALWLGLGAYGLVTFGLPALAYTSASVNAIYYHYIAYADTSSQVFAGFVCLYFAANAALWFSPVRKDDKKAVRS